MTSKTILIFATGVAQEDDMTEVGYAVSKATLGGTTFTMTLNPEWQYLANLLYDYMQDDLSRKNFDPFKLDEIVIEVSAT